MPYEWPPLTPGDPEEVARRVAAVLDDAWQRLADRQQAVIASIVARWRLPYVLASLEEFKDAITNFRSRVDTEARAFVQRQLPYLYDQEPEPPPRPSAGAHGHGLSPTWTRFSLSPPTRTATSYAAPKRRSGWPSSGIAPRER